MVAAYDSNGLPLEMLSLARDYRKYNNINQLSRTQYIPCITVYLMTRSTCPFTLL